MKLHKITAFIFLLGLIGFIDNDPVHAVTAVTQNCSISPEMANHYKSETNFNNYLKSIGRPTQITANGKTLKANRQYGVDRCVVIYGGPYDVPSGTQSFKTANGVIEPRHFGYTERGTLYSNWNFPADGVGANYSEYTKTRPFEKDPDNNAKVKARAVGKVPFPRSISGTAAVKAGHLNQAVDTFCGGVKACVDSQGSRGYWDNTHESFGFALTGANLVDYASIQSFPTDYSPGSFNTYYFDVTGKMWYATHPLAPYKKLFDDTVDLEITDINIVPVQKYSQNKIAKVEITVNNTSDRDISKTPLYYGYDGKTYCELVSLPKNKLTLITITQGQTDCNDTTKRVDMFFPNIGKATEKNYDFTAQVNPNKDNPKGESNYANNIRKEPMLVMNPNAYVTVSVKKVDELTPASANAAAADDGKLEAVVKVVNNTKSTISNLYNGKSFTIEVFETNYAADGTAANKVSPVGYLENPTYSIAPGGSQVFTFELPAKQDRTAQEFLVKAFIPNYANESTYEDNKAAARLGIQSKIDIPGVEACTEVAVYSNNLKKLCAGHFPKHPSTIFSEGMQTYHFATYRLMPQPIPSYTVSPVANSDSKQQVTYSPTQASNTFLYSSNGNTRYRMVPRFTDINYKVIFNQPNGGRVEVANGTVRHVLEDSCFSRDDIDLVHRTHCDELVLFLPNTDQNKFNLPTDYNRTKRVSVLEEIIKDTKIPFVNPGTYTFELAVSEGFLSRNQDLVDGVWSDPYWGSSLNTNFIPSGATYGREIYRLTYDYEVTGVKGAN